MKIAIVGRGNLGGGLGDLWRAAGHDVTNFGRDGGDATGADVVVVAVPHRSVAEALSNVSGLAGQPTIGGCSSRASQCPGNCEVASYTTLAC